VAGRARGIILLAHLCGFEERQRAVLARLERIEEAGAGPHR
jgi:hypothetical protein